MKYRYVKKTTKKDTSNDFEEFMIKEWYWYRDETWLHENPKKSYYTQDELKQKFTSYIKNLQH